MKKKVFAMTMAALMAASLLGCGSGSTGTSSASSESGSSSAASSSSAAEDTSSSDSDMKAIQDKGTLVIGITDFEPMDYKDANGEWVGFDADLAREFAESLGVEAEFVEIDWDNKVLELDAGSIDCVWNGMTLTDEVTSSMACSNAYCNNAQIVVCKADVADQYTTVDSLSSLSFAVESGSAGQEQADANGLSYTEVSSQANALMEVEAGTSDAAIIDSLMAAAMVGEGTSYEDLTYTVSLNDEKYGVGFRKDSDLAEELNSFFVEKYEDGTMQQIAEEYGVQAALVEQK